MTFYRLSNLAGRYNCDLALYEIDKCKKDTLVFDGDNCVGNALYFSFKFKGEPRKTIINKVVEYKFHLHAHKGTGFNTWIIINTLRCDKHIVDNIKNGKSVISLRIFNGYIENIKKQSPHYLFF